MTRYLVDTNVLSETRRPRPDQRVMAFLSAQATPDLFVSDVTFGEIRWGIEAATDAAYRLTLSRWLDGLLRPYFAGRVLSATEEVWGRWKGLNDAGRQKGYTYPQPDLVIAAIAKEHGLTVLTRDTSPFTHAGVPVLNPWTDPPA